jgi:aldehyde dehydrogenase (NAD+)
MNFTETKRAVLHALGIEEECSGVYAGEWRAAPDGPVIETRSPINDKRLAQVQSARSEEYEWVLSRSRAALAEWSMLPAPERAGAVTCVANELERRKRELGLLISLETGKPRAEGQGEVQEMIDLGRYAAGLGRGRQGGVFPSERRLHRMFEQWQPLGAVAVITSFNFPAAVWSWNAFIAAVMGDTVIWKPSSRTPLTAVACIKIVAEVMESRGLPPVFSLLCGSGSGIGDRMANDRRLPLVSFTGSVRSGRGVAAAVARRLGRSLLELGGNNAAVVTERADLALALKGVAFGALATAGQRCTSTRRLIVQEGIYQRFLASLTDLYKTISIGNPLEDKTLVGPLIDAEALKAYFAGIREARSQGGRVVYGAGKFEPPGLEEGFYAVPTLVEAEPSMPVVSEETFAPILYVMRYQTLDEACAIHNAVPQGLSSSIFTTDLREAEYFLSHRGSDCGLVNVNTSTAGAEIGGAFGGEKDTGGGRESGSDAWRAYARRQTVTINYGNEMPLAQGIRFGA